MKFIVLYNLNENLYEVDFGFLFFLGKKEEVGGIVLIKVSDSGNEEFEICDFELELLIVLD